MRKNKNRIILLVLVLLLSTSVYFEMKLWAPHRLDLHFETVTSKKLPASFDGMSVAVISDINSDIENFETAIIKLEEYAPDLILFAGNVISESKEVTSQEKLETLLKRVKAPLGKFAILSASEPDSSRMLLQTSGFTILNNQLTSVFSPSKEKINLIGFNSNITVKGDDSFTLGLTYDPQLVGEIKSLKMDAVVAGKTHLGQVNIPFIGSLLHDDVHATRRSTLNGYDLILTSGIGTREPEVRLFSHPDVLILNLKSSK